MRHGRVSPREVRSLHTKLINRAYVDKRLLDIGGALAVLPRWNQGTKEPLRSELATA